VSVPPSAGVLSSSSPQPMTSAAEASTQINRVQILISPLLSRYWGLVGRIMARVRPVHKIVTNEIRRLSYGERKSASPKAISVA
jgi:hypothetical protein